MSGKQSWNLLMTGHVDHGKTTLTSALTKFCGDHLSEDFKGVYEDYSSLDGAHEETVKGSTINLARVVFETPQYSYTLADCPNGDIQTAIPGIERLDGAVLVVCATDGPMPQTREHLELLQKRGIGNICVFLSKCDVADADSVELTEMEVRQLLNDYGFDGDQATVVRGSAKEALKNGRGEWAGKVRGLLTGLDAMMKASV